MAVNRHILFGAGGTGGHLYPALAVAEELRKIDPEIQITFAGRDDKIEARVVPAYGFKLITMDITPPILKANINSMLFPVKMVRAINKVKTYIRSNNIDTVVCAGAYISIPPGIASKKVGVKLALMESNLNPGKAVRYLSKRADIIFTAFEDTTDYFPKSIQTKTRFLGNPVRESFLKEFDFIEAQKQFGINPDKRTLLIFGGSLGAESINRAVLNNIELLQNLDINIIWQTGNSNIVDNIDIPNINVLPYIDEMHKAFAVADLIISRSGATTIAELTAAGKASVLVPLPTASTGEQQKNASIMLNRGASIVIDDKEISNLLFHVVKVVIFDNDKLEQMTENARKLGKPNASKEIASIIYEMAIK